MLFHKAFILVPFLINLVVALKQPNIVLMLADDMGWGDVPWHKAPVIAPNVLQLANSGIILDQYYVQPICTPTRSAMMTGKYPTRLGMHHGVIEADTPYGLPLNETILPSRMKELGYSVHGIGKWHLGMCSYDYTPTKRGFDSFYGIYNGMSDYYTKSIASRTARDGGYDFRYNVLGRDGKVIDKVLWEANNTYSTDLYNEKAKQVIQDHDQSKPLFLYLPMQNPHSPAQVPSRYYEKYEGVVKDETRRKLLAMVSAMDDTVKVVVDSLKQTGLWENTVFIFFSDNGGGLMRNHFIGQINWPLRGGKATYWEGGIRSAAFVHSPLIRGGTVNKELMHVTDWLPTITHVATCGVRPSSCQGPNFEDIDGINQWNAIIGAGKSSRSEFLVNYDPVFRNAAIRVGKWKLLQGYSGPGQWIPPPDVDFEKYMEHLSKCKSGGKPLEEEEQEEEYRLGIEKSSRQKIITKWIQLYDVVSDPYEKNDVSKDNRNIVMMMLRRLKIHKDKAIAPGNKKSDPQANPTNHGGVWKPWLDTC